mmetsp:Transcript_16619/g.27058  ORF Transcript_16619/g.27058 Transcript_16619/m.27058 type:complete len:83 (+) Transcript_16619:3698-3946(+)
MLHFWGLHREMTLLSFFESLQQGKLDLADDSTVALIKVRRHSPPLADCLVDNAMLDSKPSTSEHLQDVLCWSHNPAQVVWHR